jgi:hypothetical protein
MITLTLDLTIQDAQSVLDFISVLKHNQTQNRPTGILNPPKPPSTHPRGWLTAQTLGGLLDFDGFSEDDVAQLAADLGAANPRATIYGLLRSKYIRRSKTADDGTRQYVVTRAGKKKATPLTTT